MSDRDHVSDRARARRHALDALALGLGIASTPTPPVDLAWTCLCHPLALAVLEHRSPGCTWFTDPFALWFPDPKGFDEEFCIPVVSWQDGVATVNGLPMPRQDVAPEPNTVNGIDSRTADGRQIAYRVDSMVGKPTVIEVTGVLPESMDTVVGRHLRDVVEMPPIADPGLLESCGSLIIAEVVRDTCSTTFVLSPAPWVAVAPVPVDVAAVAQARALVGADRDPVLAFLHIPVIC